MATRCQLTMHVWQFELRLEFEKQFFKLDIYPRGLQNDTLSERQQFRLRVGWAWLCVPCEWV